MNAEFQRNVWIELTPRRLILMVVLLGLAFAASAIAGGTEYDVASTARLLFYVIVAVWGSRNAALAVVGEIRDRTWDMQLLSSITPGAMTWGKLFGSTIYNWFGGAICLAVLEVERATHAGLAAALVDLAYFIAVGLIAQAAAFLASLVAVRRRQSHSRLDIFVYQAIGVGAGVAVYTVWEFVKASGDAVTWWSTAIDRRGFLLASLAIFTAWTLLGCYREMRLELKMKNGILVWLLWLVFIGIYVAGFDAWLSTDKTVAGWDAGSLRLALAGVTFTALTYLMVFLEPKDRVHFRWLGSQISSGRIGAFLGGLQAWMMSYVAALLCTGVLLYWLHQSRPDLVAQLALIAAASGFLTRDVLIFVFMRSLPGRRRGDFAALGILFALYVLAPAIVNGLGLQNLLMVFYPYPTSPVWIAPVVAWAEGVAMAVLAFGQIALSRKPAIA
ncbi:MAG TPA: hypothetical protein VMF67_16170 [Rhizomicrobium sp.]|nr:hypothetical protein [Rhizomicrobium sp.]